MVVKNALSNDESIMRSGRGNHNSRSDRVGWFWWEGVVLAHGHQAREHAAVLGTVWWSLGSGRKRGLRSL